jgi:hypothetical protein
MNFPHVPCTVELHLYGLIGTTSHPDMRKIQITGFVFGNKLHGQFEVKIYSMYLHLNLPTTPDLKF